MLTEYVQYVHQHAPRCIAALCPRPIQRPAPTVFLPADLSVFRCWDDDDDTHSAFFSLGCRCGHRLLSLLAHRCEGLTGPLAVRCPACGTTAALFDTREHGYDGEQGCNTYAVGTGEPVRYTCPPCGGEDFCLSAGFSYSDPGYLIAKWPGSAQEFFGGFHLLGQCQRCRAVVEIVSFECA